MIKLIIWSAVVSVGYWGGTDKYGTVVLKTYQSNIVVRTQIKRNGCVFDAQINVYDLFA